MKPLGPFGRLATLVLAHRRAVVAVIAVLTAIAAVIGLPPKVDTDLLALLPADDPAISALHDLHEEEGGANVLTIALEGEPEALEPVVTELVDEFEALDSVRHVLAGLDPELARRVGLMQLDPDDVQVLRSRLAGAVALGPALNQIMLAPLMEMGPVTERIQQTAQGAEMFGVDGSRARLVLRPTGSSHDQVFSQQLMAEVEEVLDHTLADSDVTLTWMGGAYRHNVEDVALVRRDVAVTSAASAFMVLFVVLVFFRTWRAIPVVFVPLLIANVLNFAVVGLTVGYINTYTSFGTAVLIGLGIDFAVHLVGRYREERHRGLEVEEAIITAWDRTGPACSTAALTSAAGFVALGVADFQGFSQLGLVLGSGLVLCLVTMLVCLPVMLAWLERDPPLLLGQQAVHTQTSSSSYRLAPAGLMVFVLITAFVGASRLPEIAFEYDISATRGDGLAYDELNEEERALVRDSYAPIIVSYDTNAQLTSAQRRVDAEIAEGALPHVARSVSVNNLLPPDQERRLTELAGISELLKNPDMRYVHAQAPQLIEKLLVLRDFEPTPLVRSDIPEGLLALFGAAEGKQRLLLFPTGNMWDMRQAAALGEELERAVPGRPIASEQLVLASLFGLVRRDMPVVGILALLLVCVLTAIDLRKVPRILGACGALLAGMIWAGAAIESMGIKLSMLNVVGIPILLGIGVDVIIHLIHRLAEEGPGGVRRALRTTGVAALLSALTTILSFSSLWLASNRGVRSLGSLIVIGLSIIVLATAIVLPLAWAAGWRITKKAPGQ